MRADLPLGAPRGTIAHPAPEARHKLARCGSAGKTAKRITSAVGATLPNGKSPADSPQFNSLRFAAATCSGALQCTIAVVACTHGDFAPTDRAYLENEQSRFNATSACPFLI